jgi:hypothetical protein
LALPESLNPEPLLAGSPQSLVALESLLYCKWSRNTRGLFFEITLIPLPERLQGLSARLSKAKCLLLPFLQKKIQFKEEGVSRNASFDKGRQRAKSENKPIELGERSWQVGQKDYRGRLGSKQAELLNCWLYRLDKLKRAL